MLQLINVFWAICRLKAGPQDLPSGQYLMISAILAGIIIDSFATSTFMSELSDFDVVRIVSVYNLVLLTAVYLLLKLVGYAGRGLQTVTAIAGCGFFISLILLPSLLMIGSAEEQVNSLAIFILIDNVWRIAINAHIFRHALSINLLMAMILSLSYFIFGILVGDFLLPMSADS
jgi:hypothetical protein